ncbi:MAG TPA: methyltransferase domain-containing protein [Flavobacteriales bacterium]|nr:methyltransferase domain-containing protein [Flavobacteriales bacterium]
MAGSNTEDIFKIRRPGRRYRKTLDFLRKSIGQHERILDLGVRNPFSVIMEQAGFQVANTQGEDLDLHPDIGSRYQFTCITSFEVFEHLLAPYNLLSQVQPPPGGKITLVASVPLKVWFAKAYWNKNDPWDRHYHEFEPRQFDWLLDKAGWRIVKSETWTSPARITAGIRPFLRFFWPSYYLVHAEKVDTFQR